MRMTCLILFTIQIMFMSLRTSNKTNYTTSRKSKSYNRHRGPGFSDYFLRFAQSLTWYRAHATETHRVRFIYLCINYDIDARNRLSLLSMDLDPIITPTTTNIAPPNNSTAVLICCLIDGNSIFQVSRLESI